MTFAYIIGILTVVTSLAVKIIGYPTQIMKVHKSKNADNLSITLATISFITYICWTIHGIIKQDFVVIAGQSLGIVTSGILLFQILKYRNHKNQ